VLAPRELILFMSERIAIFLPNWIGDVVMATPFLRAVREHFRDAEITGILKPYVAEVLEGTTWLNHTLAYDPRGKAGFTNWGLLQQLRARRLDKIVLLTNSLRTGMLAALSGAKERLGYARDWRGWMLTQSLVPPRQAGRWEPISAVDYYLALAARMGCHTQDRTLQLACTAKDELAAEHVWNKLQLPTSGLVVALHAAGGWGGTATAKAWPAEHFGELAHRMATQYHAHVLVLCGPNERETAREIVRRANHTQVVSLAEETLGIGLTKACLQRTSLLVSTDSGPRHIATAFNVPTVGLFGATDPRWAETYHPRGMTLFNKLDCGPCAKQHCPLGHHACMRELSVDRVFQAVQMQMEHIHSKAA
jgi:heptosyltransferase-2